MSVLRKIVVLVPLLALGFLPFVVGAVTGIGTGGVTGITTLSGIDTALGNVLGIMQTLLFALVAIFITIAAFQYLTAQGDSEKTKTAKNMIIYAIVALVIALIAGGVAGLVQDILI